jgi:hypothetical protein
VLLDFALQRRRPWAEPGLDAEPVPKLQGPIADNSSGVEESRMLAVAQDVVRELEFEAAPDEDDGARLIEPNDLANAFERVVVINLTRRPDRLARLSKRLEGNWPFAAPRRFEAIDGSRTSPPATWKKGAGAWGCAQSHRAVLDAAIADGVSSLLVLEDDAYVADDFASRAELFLARVPEDWDCLMLGAEHLLPPDPVAPGVARCRASIRCHAYAVRGPLMPMLSAFWQCNKIDHCDLVLSSLMGHYKAFAPDPLLIGQDAGWSDITPRLEPLRFLSPAVCRTR